MATEIERNRRYLREAQVREIMGGISRWTLRRIRAAHADFPDPIRLSQTLSLFDAGEVESWILRRAAQRPNDQAA